MANSLFIANFLCNIFLWFDEEILSPFFLTSLFTWMVNLDAFESILTFFFSS